MLDFTGTILSLLATYYFTQSSKRAWQISILAIAINGHLYWTSGIYGQSSLQLFYLSTSIYGLYRWREAHRENFVVYKLSMRQWILLGFTGFIIFYIVYGMLVYSSSDIPILDGTTTTLSILAQILMCYKIINTWQLWLLADAIYAVIYIQKQLPYHVLSMSIYILLVITGWRSWKNKILIQSKAASYLATTNFNT